MSQPTRRRLGWLLPLAVAATLGVAACGGDEGSGDAAATGSVPEFTIAGATSNPLEVASTKYVSEVLAAKHGIKINLKVIEDTRQMNELVNRKEIDGDVAQHAPFALVQNEEQGYKLAPVAPLFVQHYTGYSKKYGSLEELPDGATIAIPDDPANEALSLRFLQEKGILKLDDSVKPATLTSKDITENPKHLKFDKIKGSTIPRVLDDVDLGIGTAYTFFEADIDKKYQIAAIDGFPEYALQLVIHQDNVADPKFKKLIEAFKDPSLGDHLVKEFPQLISKYPSH